MKSSTFLIAKVLFLIGDDEPHFGALGQIRGLIEHEATIVDVGLERLHRLTM